MQAVEAAPTSTTPKISTHELSFYYRSFRALFEVSLDIFPNQITALIGPSGCGKSTFIRCLNRMNELIDGARHEGQIFIDGMDIYGPSVDPVELRKEVGMVFQKPNPFPMSVYDNIAYGPRLHGKPSRPELDEIVQESLTKASLWEEVKDKLKNSALNLSGGQQQRLCIARAMAVRPKIILMDEPCSALDPSATIKIEELMLELKRDYTIVIVTHNMQQALRASDNTAFFLSGRVEEYDKTQAIFLNPQKKTTEDYISGRFG